MSDERRFELGRRGFLGVAGSVAVTPPEIAELNASVAAIRIEGARLPEGVLALSGVEAAPKN
jgi:hypothetical protein